MDARTLPAHELDALADRIAATAASIDAACHRLLTDLRRFDAAEGWARHGALSCAHWLSWRCGIALGAAREHVRVARALAGLPLLDAALARAEVSYSKARAMTRIATPANEANLVEMARHSTAAQLEKICRLHRQTQRRPAAHAPERWMRVRHTDDGLVRIEVQLRPDEAARVLEACGVSAETRVDGLVALAERELRGDAPDRPPAEVLVHIDASTLEGETGDHGIPAETSRRLLCDAGVVPVLEDAQAKPLDVGRKLRTIPPSLRRALVARDRGCRFPGCGRSRFVDGHHLRHWADGGETSLDNTILLCSRHHTLVHEGGFRVERDDDGRLRFLSPAGIEIPQVPAPPADIQALEGPPAAAPGWGGDRISYDLAVSALM